MLAGVDVHVHAGELVALLGPSGSGKTTLLRIIAGLEQPSAGRILFGGEDATAVPVQARGVGFVFQHYALFRHITVAENIAYGLRVRPRALAPVERGDPRAGGGPARPRAASRAGAALSRASSRAASASASRSPARWPSIPRCCCSTSRSARSTPRCARTCGAGCATSTSGPATPRCSSPTTRTRRWRLADRVAILNQGRLEQIGTPDEIYEHPATAFVAGFVGEATRLPVVSRGGTVRLGPHALALNGTRLADGPAALFVRPRDLVLADGGEANALPATVVAVRRAGPARRAELHLGEGLPTVEMELPADAVIGKGDVVQVALTRLRVFGG